MLKDRSRALTNSVVVVVSVILMAQVTASYAISITERPLPTPGLQDLPLQIGDWTMTTEEALEPGVKEYLRPDDYIMRGYTKKDHSTSLNLFVAYFKSLQSSYGPHSPRVCLPGAGWLTRDSRIMNVPVEGIPEGILVNEYTMEKNGQQILVHYWYQNNRRVWAEEFQAKLHLLPDLLRYRRSDVSLVRLVSPLGRNNERPEISQKQSVEFARQIFPLLVERIGK